MRECKFMEHFYRNVPKLGHVAVSRHAQSQCEEHGISEDDFRRTLLEGRDTPDGQHILWRERGGVRLVIELYPTPNRGARLVKTVYRIEAQAKAVRSAKR